MNKMTLEDLEAGIAYWKEKGAAPADTVWVDATIAGDSPGEMIHVRLAAQKLLFDKNTRELTIKVS